MSLTKQDLAAIKKIVDDRIDLSDQIAAESFEDVYTRLDSIDALLETMDSSIRRIDNVQQAELERNDNQDSMLKTQNSLLQKVANALHVE